ncbi:MAG: calcium-binding protein [Paracoccaceae bacterium]
MEAKLNILGSSGLQVSASHVGANYLTHIDDVNDGTFDNTLNELSIGALRFPGGAIIETEFDVTNWDATISDASGDRLTPTSDYLAFIEANNLTTTFVLPTKNLLLGDVNPASTAPRSLDAGQIDATVDFVRKLFSASDTDLVKTNIVALEFGNEYWGSGAMTSLEYGIVANELANRLDTLFDELVALNDVTADFVRPKLLVQMGQPWAPEFASGGYLETPTDGSGSWTWGEKIETSNRLVIAPLDTNARQAIDGVVKHFYYKEPHLTDAKFTNTGHSSAWITKNFQYWENAQGFGDLEIHITEWNVSRSNVNQLGMSAGSTTVQMLENMIRAGVDSAQIWSLQHNTSTNLFDNGVTVQGAVFDLMAEVLPGSTLLNDNLFGQSFEVSAYENGAARHLFISLREEYDDRLKLDLSDVLPVGSTLAVTVVGVDMSTSDGSHVLSGFGRINSEYYHEHDTRPVIRQLGSEDILSESGVLTLDLKPYEVARVDINYAGNTSNTDGGAIQAGDEADRIVGSDADDTIIGGVSPNDLRDVIFAGKGNDHVEGGYGNDEIYGGEGGDMLLGGFGADKLVGQHGDDVIAGGALSDLIFGNDGNDFINGGYGHDRINGGQGADKFYHLGVHGHGTDWIQDFTAADGDVLLFADNSANFDDFHVNFAETTSAGQIGVKEAFVVYQPTGQIIWALIDGEAQSELMIQLGSSFAEYDLLM